MRSAWQGWVEGLQCSKQHLCSLAFPPAGAADSGGRRGHLRVQCQRARQCHPVQTQRIRWVIDWADQWLAVTGAGLFSTPVMRTCQTPMPFLCLYKLRTWLTVFLRAWMCLQAVYPTPTGVGLTATCLQQ